MYVRTYAVWYCSCTMYVLVSQSCPAILDSGGFIERGGGAETAVRLTCSYSYIHCNCTGENISLCQTVP